MRDRALPWLIRAMCAVLPFTLGAALSDALHGRSDPVRATVAIACWAVWAGVMAATLVLHPISLTVLRCTAPAAAGVLAASVVAGGPSGLHIGLAAANCAVVVVLAFSAATGVAFVDGPSYANERRFPLAAPGLLLLGPLELSWVLLVGLPATAALLLAAKVWVAGTVAAVLAIPAVFYLSRAVHNLHRRWLVFVPAGVVLHDPASLPDPVLFMREAIESLGPAPSGSDGLDLTQGAVGLALELALKEKMPVARDKEAQRVLFTPSRPGAVLREAGQRAVPPPRTSPSQRAS